MKIKDNILNIEWRTKAFKPALLVLCLVSVTLYSTLLVGFQFLGQKKVVQAQVKQNPFDGVVVEAKSVFVWDVINQRPLYQKNADAPRPLASLTKVMTAVTASS